MTLDKIFEKYNDDDKIYRTSIKHPLPATIKWAKSMKAWGSQEARDLGFIIPQFMIDDTKSDY